MDRIPARWQVQLCIVPAALGVVLVLATAWLTHTQPDQPVLNHTFYSINADSGKAGWVAQTHLPDATLAPLFGQDPHAGHLSDYFPTSVRENVWVQDAPAIAATPPELRVIEDTTNGNERILRLHIRSTQAVYGIMADVTAQDAIYTASLYGERYNRETPRSNIFFKVISVPESGVELALTLQPGVPVTILLADVSQGLPLNPGQREAFETSLRSGFGGGHGVDSMTLVHRKYSIP